MSFVASLAVTTLWVGSGLVIPPSGPSPAPVDPPPGLPITDPSHEPVYSGLGHEPDVQGAFNTPTILFVNFDGPFINGGCGNDSRNDCSTIFPNNQFNASPADDATRAAVVQATREDVVDFGVIVVGERPPQSNPYAMVVVGTPQGGGPAGVGGVAPGIDCGNNNPNITSFSFLVNASANTQATVIHQEAAHTWGLEHVDDDTDNLFPSTGGGINPQYQDTCSRIVADTQLTPTNSGCNSVHTMFCETNFQNSYQEMLLLFGPPIPDTVAPSIIIESPLDGDVFDYNEAFDLTITLSDDRAPQLLDTSIFFDDTEAASTTLIDSTLTFPVNGGDPPGGHGLSNGPHTIRVDIEDESGNPATAEVTIEITNSPFGEPSGEDGPGGTVGDDDSGSDDSDGTTPSPTAGSGPIDDTGDDKGCSCRSQGEGGSAPWALGLLALGLLRRRRD